MANRVDDVLGGNGQKRAHDAEDMAGIRKKRGRVDGPPAPPPPPEPARVDERPPKEQHEQDDDDDSESDVDYGGLALNKEDRKRLRNMPELEREMELSHRAELLQKQKERKALLGEGAGPPLSARRRAETAALDELVDSDDGGQDPQDVRRSARQQKQTTTKSSKMDSLASMKATRDRKADAPPPPPKPVDARAVARLEAESGEEGASGDEHGAGGADARQDDEEEDLFGADEVEEEAAWDEVKNMQVRRADLEDWSKHPRLEDTLIGAIVRVALAKRQGGDNNQYCMCVVHDVVIGKPYTFQGECNKHLVIINAADQKQHTIPFSLVSNSHVELEEYMQFHQEIANGDLDQIKKSEAAAVVHRLAGARAYTLTAADVSRIVREKREKGLVRKSLAMQKADLTLARDAALEAGDADGAARATEALERLMDKIADRTAADREAADRLQALNKRAVLENRARLKAAKSKAAATGGTLDPYSRKATKVVQYWSTGKKGEAEARAASGQGAALEAQVRLTAVEELQHLDVRCDTTQKERTQALVARRLLGPQYRFRPTSRADRTGKEVISLDRYQEKLGGERFRALGLT